MPEAKRKRRGKDDEEEEELYVVSEVLGVKITRVCPSTITSSLFNHQVFTLAHTTGRIPLLCALEGLLCEGKLVGAVELLP